MSRAPLGIDFRQQGFRTAVTADVVSMMGGGVCWLDVDNDGWLDLYAVNSYADRDLGYWQQHGGLPRNALYRNVRGTFTDVSRRSGSDLSLRGNGCVAGDLNGDGFTDLYVTRRPATTRCSGTTATGTSARAHARRGSRPTAGTREPPSAT